MSRNIVTRSDYRAPSHQIDNVFLDFQLHPTRTCVTSKIEIAPTAQESDLLLNGRELELEYIKVDGRVISEGSGYSKLPNGDIIVHGIDHAVTLEIRNYINPQANKSLLGLYLSNGNFTTQCEAEGFRRITYYPDRPDVSAKFTVRLAAPKQICPVMLSNGNLIDSGDINNIWHFTKWEDPFRKPAYLFALVAGKFVAREERYKLANGKDVLLQVWVEPQNADKTEHAMESLKHAIAWDERRFGLELDLERFMIVATDDFTMGAMENKGLNIFNSKCILANPSVATDADYEHIEGTIGHEYFHNWTGDRVTLRDWFQLTLKEGLTVFRDQEFSSDMLGSEFARARKRIDDVSFLRDRQFAEDAGPMAHPVRPESYEEINNFYTVTVYEKGAEIFRMLQTLLGREGFKKGLHLYLDRNDGKGATCEDILNAMQEATGKNLSQFARWFSQPGTPHIKVSAVYDEDKQTLSLTLRQSNPKAEERGMKAPLLIPFDIAFFNPLTGAVPLRLTTEGAPRGISRVLELRAEEETFVFGDIKKSPILSLNRNFSAPVIVEYEANDQDLAYLAKNDTDPFSRWEAMQTLALRALDDMISDCEAGDKMVVPGAFKNAFTEVLRNKNLSPIFKTALLKLPGESRIAQTQALIDPQVIRRALSFLKEQLGREYANDFMRVFDDNIPSPAYTYDPDNMGKRGLRGLCFEYLLAGGSTRAFLRAKQVFETAQNATEKLDALKVIVNSTVPSKVQILQQAEEAWRNEPLLINKWLALQATSTAGMDGMSVIDMVKTLRTYPNYNINNPNNVYSLILAFCSNNPGEFHREDGAGYRLWAEEVIKLDKINPIVASRLARCLDNWRRYAPAFSKQMYEALCTVYSEPGLSPDVHEVIRKALGENPEN